MKSVQLLVRSPSVATPDDFSVDIGVEQSISELKHIIEDSHQASPLACDMRIIWKGRVLQDTDTVRGIYADEEASEAQTVHFVLSSPTSVAPAPIHNQQQQQQRQHLEDAMLTPSSGGHGQLEYTDSGGAKGSTEDRTTRPSVVPLSNQFQYVLVDGVPYLMVLKPVGLARPEACSQQQQQQQQQLSAALVGSGSGETQTLGRLNAHLEMRNRMLQELEETSERLERLMALNRTRDRGQRGGRVRARRAADNAAENGHPLADALRNFNFGAVWGVGWMLLRMLLLVVVFAHDASLDRILVLTVVVGCFFALRTPLVQQHLAWLNQRNANNHAADARRQQFSVWEKTKALVVALLTSLVPSEPFQAPVAEE
ncbi:hypothetical protein GGI20_001685 [Coemansia sp. BCRC 34301]|nr:hypothetical protein GGI20_001685 [Coemansia sp. BCRC 34301]